MKKRSFALALAGLAFMAGSAMAAPLTIAVQSPEGLTIQVSAAGRTGKSIKSVSSQPAGGYYLATFGSGLPANAKLVCAKVATAGWKIVNNDGSSADKVCFPPDRLTSTTVNGGRALVLIARFQKV